MANDENQSRANLTSNSLIVAVLVAASTYFIVREAPLQGSRPTVMEPRLHEKVGKQDIEARLWQDPFTAVARSIGKPDRSKVEQRCEPPDDHCKSPLAQVVAPEETLVIGVTISRAPYSEQVEFRRRLRYAVLAGLDRAGFEPEDAQHIGYFRPKENKKLPLPAVVPFEWFESDLSRRIIVFWLDERVLADNPLEQLHRLVDVLRSQYVTTQLDLAKVTIRILGPEVSDTLLAMAKEAKGAKGPQTSGTPRSLVRREDGRGLVRLS